ncbi:hypothetical protein DJ81_17160 [Halorubrum sp. Hd13]|nr:hypothetical protein DJ81_17160 [Halorubrum sp. Hd13]OYR46259.1 hypothetical protein DJ75_06350 [Halorubrum sp. Eb13]
MRSAGRHRPYTSGPGRSGARSDRVSRTTTPGLRLSELRLPDCGCPNRDWPNYDTRTFRPAASPNDSAPVTGSRS